jgi:hypothetical protein
VCRASTHFQSAIFNSKEAAWANASTGHDEHTNGVAYWEGILRTTEEAIRKAEAQRKE